MRPDRAGTRPGSPPARLGCQRQTTRWLGADSRTAAPASVPRGSPGRQLPAHDRTHRDRRKRPPRPIPNTSRRPAGPRHPCRPSTHGRRAERQAPEPLDRRSNALTPLSADETRMRLNPGTPYEAPRPSARSRPGISANLRRAGAPARQRHELRGEHLPRCWCRRRWPSVSRTGHCGSRARGTQDSAGAEKYQKE